MLKKLLGKLLKLFQNKEQVIDVVAVKLERVLAEIKNLPWSQNAKLNGVPVSLFSAAHKPQPSGAPFLFTFRFTDTNGASRVLTAAYSPRNIASEQVTLDGIVMAKSTAGGVSLSGKADGVKKLTIKLVARWSESGLNQTFETTAEIESAAVIASLLS